MSERDPLILQTNVREVQHTEVAIRGIGTSVLLRKDVYAHSNHIVIQSRPYFRRNLPTYFYFPFVLNLAWLLFFASLLGALALEGGYYKGSPFYCFVVYAFFITVFSQHEIVNRRSIPVVLMQPFFDGQIPLNALYEVTITQLQGLHGSGELSSWNRFCQRIWWKSEIPSSEQRSCSILAPFKENIKVYALHVLLFRVL